MIQRKGPRFVVVAIFIHQHRAFHSTFSRLMALASFNHQNSRWIALHSFRLYDEWFFNHHQEMVK